MNSEPKKSTPVPTSARGLTPPALAEGADLLARSCQQRRAERDGMARSPSPKTVATTVNIEFGPRDEHLVLAVWADDGGAIPDTGTEDAARNDIARRLMDRIPECERLLRRRGYSDRVTEAAIDRVIAAAVRHLSGSETIPPPDDWAAWLFGSVRQAASQVASRLPPCRSVDPAALDAVSGSVPDPDPESQWVADALTPLTAKQRQVVELCVLGDRSVADAARAMNCYPSTVTRHLSRALARLRREVNSELVRLCMGATGAS